MSFPFILKFDVRVVILPVCALILSACLPEGYSILDPSSTSSGTLAITSPAADTAAMGSVTIQGTCSMDSNVHVAGTGASATQDVSCSSGTFSATVTFSGGDGSKEVILSQTISGSTVSVARNFISDSGQRALTLSGATTQAEGQNFVITATLESASPIQLAISYQTENNEALPFQSRAEAVQDYTQTSGRLTFAPGETVKTMTIPTLTSSAAEQNEQFNLRFLNASGITMSSLTSTLTITDSNTPLIGADVEKLLTDVGPTAQPAYLAPTALATLYVDSATGSDTNPGSTESAPLATVQKAADLAAPGTEVIVKNGTYREQINIATSGTAANPIIFKNFPGHQPIITGSNQMTGIQLVNDVPQENSDLFTTGFEESSISSSLSISSPVADGATGVSIDADSAHAAHGLQSVVFSYTNPSASNKGSTLVRSFGTARSAGKPKLFFRAYMSLSSNFTLDLSTRIDIARLEGLNASDVSTNHVRLLLRKDGTNNRYYFDVLNSAGTSMGDSRTSSTYITPGAGFLYYELGFDSTDATNPVKLSLNGTAQALTNQLTPTSCIINTIRFGTIHNSSASVGYPTAGASMNYDSVRISASNVGSFTPIWPPTTMASNDFETSLGTFTKVEANSNVVDLSTSQHKFGAQSARFSFNGTGATLALKDVMTSKEDVYVRFFLYLENFDLTNNNTSAGTNTYRWNLMTLSEGTTARVVLGVAKTAQGLKMDARVLTPDVTNVSNYYKGYPGELKSGNWYQIEMRFRGNDATTGGSELWLNATSIAGNYDRTTTPDVYAALDTSGMRINTIAIGDATTGQPYSSTTYPTSGSKMYIDDYRINVGAPSGLLANSDSLRMYKAAYDPALYSGSEYTKPGVVIQTDSTYLEGKSLIRLDHRNTVSAGSFAVESNTIYFRPVNDETMTGKSMEFGVRDVAFKLDNKDYNVIQGFNLRGANHGNQGVVYMKNGSSNNKVINNLIQGSAAAGVRMEASLNGAGTAIIKSANNNAIIGNHIRDNTLTFGSGIRIDNSGSMLVENNWFESDLGSNITSECIGPDICTGYKIRRNKFTSAGESNIYLSKYSADGEIYQNVFHGARSSSYRTMRDGIRNSSGGSGIHLARNSRNHKVFGNLIYDVDGSGVTLRAKVLYTKIFNNTIAQVAGKGIGNGIDYQKDAAESYLPDTDGNGIIDGLEDVEQNASFNNLLSMVPGSNRCIDVEGHDPDNTNAPVIPDTSNKSDYNAFFQCGRVALFNSTGYTEATFANYIADTLSISGLQRDSHSSILPMSTPIYQDAANFDFRPVSPITGACVLGTNCPWNP